MKLKINFKSTYWQHFFLFYIINIFLTTFTYWIFRDANQHSIEMYYANIVEIIRLPVFVTIMILTYKGSEKLNFEKKLIPLIGLLLIEFVWTFLINYINFFDRAISQSDIIIGVKNSLKYYLLMFIICLPIIGLVKTRIKNVC